jgi:hypothetical protein
MALLSGKLIIELDYESLPRRIAGTYLFPSSATLERSSTALVWSKPTTAVPGQAKKTSKNKIISLRLGWIGEKKKRRTARPVRRGGFSSRKGAKPQRDCGSLKFLGTLPARRGGYLVPGTSLIS